MARYGVSIVKQVSFRGVNQEFSNVYYYEGPTLDEAGATALAAAVKANEVQFHSTDVTFVRFSVWTAGGSPGTNQMISQGTLSGAGTQSLNSSMDRERAVLVQWPAGFDSRGHRVYLRKWFHSCGYCCGQSWTPGNLQNTSALSTAQKNAIVAAAAGFDGVLAAGGSYDLCAKSGRQPSLPAQAHPWLEHHQLGDMWR